MHTDLDSSPAEERLALAEAAILYLAVLGHPRRLSILGLALLIASDERDPSVELAIRELVGAGLLECEGRRVLATRQARAAAQLALAPRSAQPSH